MAFGLLMMVPGARIELALCFQNRILNPARLPVPPPRQGMGAAAHRWHCPPWKGAKYILGLTPPPPDICDSVRLFSGKGHLIIEP